MVNRYNKYSYEDFESSIYKKNILYAVCLVFIMTMLGFIFKIQVLSENKNSSFAYNQDIIRPQRGQIFLQNYALNTPKALTLSNYSTRVIINPINLKKITAKVPLLDLNLALSSILSYPSKLVSERMDLGMKETNQYFILFPKIESVNAIQLKSTLNDSFYLGSDYSKYDFGSWLGYEDIELRIYPENNIASPVVGYLSDNFWANEDIIKDKRCGDIVDKNSVFQANGYKVGLSGIEGKYCSKLYGSNGMRGVTTSKNGENINLTLDYNIQKEAERINEQLIKDNSNNKGKPKNVATIIVEVNNQDQSKNGRVVAMASNPTFNPNEYSKEYESKPEAFLNYVTDVPYEAGSVLKPLMVSSLLNEYFINKESSPGGTCASNSKLCVGPNWTFKDQCGGKSYTYGDETIKIKNYNGNCFEGNLGLKEVLRDSINTGIADMSKYITTESLRSYFADKFNFGKVTGIEAYNEASGNVQSMFDNGGYNINNAFIGFGQGFTTTPAQLAQSYIPLVSGGFNYPIKYIENKETSKPIQVLKPETTKYVKDYMAAVSSEGYRGTGSKLLLDGYGNGTKTGTAQIARSLPIKGPDGKPLLDEQGKEKRSWCDYNCNSEKGLYEHTLVGFAPVNKPRFIIVMKISEPRPYESANTSANQVLSKPWKELMQYTLDYMQVPKEY
jgi:cell division protein FtsI/penicillin-binding protein 2